MLVDDKVGGAALRYGSEGLEHCRVRVAEHVGPRAEQVVDVFVAAHVPEMASLRLTHDEIELGVERQAPGLSRKDSLGLGD